MRRRNRSRRKRDFAVFEYIYFYWFITSYISNLYLLRSEFCSWLIPFESFRLGRRWQFDSWSADNFGLTLIGWLLVNCKVSHIIFDGKPSQSNWRVAQSYLLAFGVQFSRGSSWKFIEMSCPGVKILAARISVILPHEDKLLISIFFLIDATCTNRLQSLLLVKNVWSSEGLFVDMGGRGSWCFFLHHSVVSLSLS